MGKLIGAINMTLDGYCDHTAITPDAEIHQHYEQLLLGADAILYGRITYQLMEYWKTLLKNPSGEKAMDDFALAIDGIPKIVFSHTLKTTGWESARLADRPLVVEVLTHKKQAGKSLVGCRSLIIQLLKLNLLDELQLCVHPVIAGAGLPLFDNLKDRKMLKLIKTKTFKGGAVLFYYEPDKAAN
ncbi:dihydrofolate reductase family protein [Aequorivita todarodis]|uniref:dihydrofolate reductase family protein n=1 Tax=Aequorivita todarodis TaxID=2036821 RepID=UPI0023505072|nr:dihydrofolate reductase family protein [Aequorivita todarodis]MDC8001926.1 dihydrofolate reductase family protein [Aequorivita todarodis]